MNFNHDEISLAVFVAMLVTLIVIAGLITYGMTHSRKPAQDGGSESRGWFKRLHREKAIVRTLFTQALALMAILGFQPDTEIILLIEGIAVSVAALWIRWGVTPVDDPDMEAIEEAKAG